MKKLPKIFKSEKKPKSHNKEYCFVKEREPIKEEIDDLFNSLGPIYRKRVLIKTKDQLIDTYILKRSNGIIKTINNNTILEDDIESIRRIY